MAESLASLGPRRSSFGQSRIKFSHPNASQKGKKNGSRKRTHTLSMCDPKGLHDLPEEEQELPEAHAAGKPESPTVERRKRTYTLGSCDSSGLHKEGQAALAEREVAGRAIQRPRLSSRESLLDSTIPENDSEPPTPVAPLRLASVVMRQLSRGLGGAGSGVLHSTDLDTGKRVCINRASMSSNGSSAHVSEPPTPTPGNVPRQASKPMLSSAGRRGSMSSSSSSLFKRLEQVAATRQTDLDEVQHDSDTQPSTSRSNSRRGSMELIDEPRRSHTWTGTKSGPSAAAAIAAHNKKKSATVKGLEQLPGESTVDELFSITEDSGERDDVFSPPRSNARPPIARRFHSAKVGSKSTGAPELDVPVENVRFGRAHSDSGSPTMEGPEPRLVRNNSMQQRAKRVEGQLDLATNTKTFGVSTTSPLEPEAIMQEIMRALESENLSYEITGPHMITCRSRGAWVRRRSSRRRRSLDGTEAVTDSNTALVWEMEVVKLPRINLNGIRLKRITGDLWSYKQKVEQLVAKMKL